MIYTEDDFLDDIEEEHLRMEEEYEAQFIAAMERLARKDKHASDDTEV